MIDEKHRALRREYMREYMREYRTRPGIVEHYRAYKREYEREYRTRPGNAEKYRECIRRWRETNPERVLNNTLRHDHGISLDDYKKMFDAQNGECAICAEAYASGPRLAVDHDHKTGGIRGLLRGSCNGGLGLFRDDPHRLRAAIEYLDGNRDCQEPEVVESSTESTAH